ncbi:MAG: MFS transporter [marine bacterium B5-7]|nr:MAG: MFS transporter [marine bacterium B5-7]
MKFQERLKPEWLLLLLAAAIPLSFATWSALLNNFAIERAAFTGVEMGILQSIREIPGFLAFTVIFLLLLSREQALAYLSLGLLGIGTMITGWFPSVIGLYVTTVIMSTGYHYVETLHSSLTLQWLDKKDAPEFLGKVIAVGSFAGIVVFALIWLGADLFKLDYRWMYLVGGGVTLSVGVFCAIVFPMYPQGVEQRRTMVLRKRYWLYYVLTFLSGARRQIFVVFAGFLMVEKFGYSVAAISMLFLVNAVLNILFAHRIGRLVGRVGERSALVFEYAGLIIIFTAYAFVNNANIAAGLYIADHFFFALAIGIKTYFQKIADPADIASSAGVSFTINHIAAVILPATLGILWIASPKLVFLAGTAMAVLSLLCSLKIPRNPAPGNETTRVIAKPTVVATSQ